MATIRPSSDLRNRYNEISEFCNTNNEASEKFRLKITRRFISQMIKTRPFMFSEF